MTFEDSFYKGLTFYSGIKKNYLTLFSLVDESTLILTQSSRFKCILNVHTFVHAHICTFYLPCTFSVIDMGSIYSFFKSSKRSSFKYISDL